MCFGAKVVGTVSRVAIAVLLMTTMMTAKTEDKLIGKAIFLQKSDGTLQPIYPVRLTVTLERDGNIVQRAGSLSCEVRARVTKAGDRLVTQTILRCDDNNTYVVTGQVFQGDK